ncbi:hypothetical protein BJ165DRAFT_1533971 [Panaeolus papilionaceus]|nr:hypothetical protein BJ165DRAFT_1533971 [Panaeolus papilionaceus]
MQPSPMPASLVPTKISSAEEARTVVVHVAEKAVSPVADKSPTDLPAPSPSTSTTILPSSPGETPTAGARVTLGPGVSLALILGSGLNNASNPPATLTPSPAHRSATPPGLLAASTASASPQRRAPLLKDKALHHLYPSLLLLSPRCRLPRPAPSPSSAPAQKLNTPPPPSASCNSTCACPQCINAFTFGTLLSYSSRYEELASITAACVILIVFPDNDDKSLNPADREIGEHESEGDARQHSPSSVSHHSISHNPHSSSFNALLLPSANSMGPKRAPFPMYRQATSYPYVRNAANQSQHTPSHSPQTHACSFSLKPTLLLYRPEALRRTASHLMMTRLPPPLRLQRPHLHQANDPLCSTRLKPTTAPSESTPYTITSNYSQVPPTACAETKHQQQVP